MKEWYTEIYCDDCPNFVGYMIDSGPRGSIICESCYENQDEESSDDEEL